LTRAFERSKRTPTVIGWENSLTSLT
jgi:hypothetical protein